MFEKADFDALGMENGISTASPASSAGSVNSADSIRNATLNGFAYNNSSYRERFVIFGFFWDLGSWQKFTAFFL
jgi:hypothetical protein